MKLTSKNKGKYGNAYTEYTGTKGKFKFKAQIYDDGSGEYELRYGRNVIDCREDATLKYWKEDLAFDKEKIQALEDFFELTQKVEDKNKAKNLTKKKSKPSKPQPRMGFAEYRPSWNA